MHCCAWVLRRARKFPAPGLNQKKPAPLFAAVHKDKLIQEDELNAS